MERNFYYPKDMESHIYRIFAGEYRVLRLTKNQVAPRIEVLDIGANVGAFAMWAKQTLPFKEIAITCVEPNPKALEFLKKNLEGEVTIIEKAVSLKPGPAKLYFGKNNLGEASLTRGEEQVKKNIIVETIEVEKLPMCDFIKLDCEGQEDKILKKYLSSVGTPTLIAIEYNDFNDFTVQKKELEAKGYIIDNFSGTGETNITAVYVKTS